MAKALTTKSIVAAKPVDSRREIPDPALSGLYLVVQPSGVKSWALRYRYSGKPKKLTLGRWPIMGRLKSVLSDSAVCRFVKALKADSGEFLHAFITARLDGWETLRQPIANEILDRAA